MVFSRPILRFALFLLILSVPFAVFAGPVGNPSGGGANIDWTLNVSGHDRIVLSVATPSGDVITREFAAGKTVTFGLKDLPKPEDGVYTYQLTAIQRLPEGADRGTKAARQSGDEGRTGVAKAITVREPIVQNGAFTIQNGSILAPDLNEGQREVSSPATPAGGNASRPGQPVVNDQVIPDDLIVQGSECVGLDCVNNESFGFDTIRLKENNTRIKADDTSTSAGFPANDWQLTFNDSASGGSSKFSVEDITGSKVPFTITAGASTNSIFVDSTGRVGFRTSTPVLDLHINTSNTPAIRLEQNNSGGFTAQTWDVAGNEANFFVRDVTGGSRLPFRIRPGAATSSIDINANGNTGVGTASPSDSAKMTVLNSDTGEAVARLQNSSAGGFSGIEYLDDGGNVDLFFGIINSNSTTRMNSLNGNDIVLMTNTSEKLRINNTNGVTVTGNFTVTGVKNFAMVDPKDSKKAIYFAALEGPEAGTYFRGTAKTINGEVVINLPGAFARITENERMTVQLTPVGAPAQLYVASKTPEQLVIKVADGSTDVEFDYLVQGVRLGYLNYQAERDNNLPK